MSTTIQNTLSRAIPLHEGVELALQFIVMRQQGCNDVLIPNILSNPGAGKTSVIKHILKKYGFGIIISSPALERMEKFSGIPNFGKDEDGDLITIWSMPELLTRIKIQAKKFPWVIVFFDDIHLAGPEIQIFI